MIQQQTRELIELASGRVERIFRERGEILPVYHIIHADGRTEILPAPPCDKDTSMAIMRAYFTISKIRRYVLIDEAWRLDLQHCSKEECEAAVAFCRQHGVRNHPKCIEAVMFSAEDEWGQHNAYRIIERKDGRAKLGPLVFDPEGGSYEGRMVGLMVPPGTPQ